MANLNFSIPYNNDPYLLDEIFKIKKVEANSIREIFLSGPQEYSGSGRVIGQLSMNQFIGVVDRIHKEGIRVNLVLNSVCEGSDWYSPKAIDRMMEYIEEVHERHGVEAITLANPIYIKEARKRFPDIEICASVLSEIDSVKKAVIFKEAGADTITPDANINRDLKLLKEIKKATGVELKIMVNEGCLYRCPFRKFHFNYISHRSQESGRTKSYRYDFPTNCCLPITINDPTQILKSGWVRPEDIGKYKEITGFFKIVGREAPTSRTLRIIKAYMEESWNGDLLDIMGSSLLSLSLKYGTYLDNKSLDRYDFFSRITSCNHNCNQCSYCEDIINELLTLGHLTKEKLSDRGCAEEAVPTSDSRYP
jgi:collagenase-like PrtC family protease